MKAICKIRYTSLEYSWLNEYQIVFIQHTNTNAVRLEQTQVFPSRLCYTNFQYHRKILGNTEVGASWPYAIRHVFQTITLSIIWFPH